MSATTTFVATLGLFTLLLRLCLLPLFALHSLLLFLLRSLLLQRKLTPLLQQLASARTSSEHQGELAADSTCLERLEQR